jgi:hypothetical protein
VFHKEPWRLKKKLFLFRAKGSYSKREYDDWLKMRLASRWERLTARMIASCPGAPVNFVSVVRYYLFDHLSGAYLTDLVESPFYFAKRFGNPKPPCLSGKRRGQARFSVATNREL